MPQIPAAFVFGHRGTDSYLVLDQIFPFEKEKSNVSAPTLAPHSSVCLSIAGDLRHAHCSILERTLESMWNQLVPRKHSTLQNWTL